MDRFNGIGIIKNQPIYDATKLDEVLLKINELKKYGDWKKEIILGLFIDLLPDFDHKETGKYLDQKM